MSGMNQGQLRAARERIVEDHLAAEVDHDFARALATFARPRYEIAATSEVHDGADAVSAFYRESDTAFPDFQLVTRRIQYADDAVFHTVIFRGTHLGAWRGLPATGRRVEYPMLNVFLFEEDRLVCEEMYFDLLTPLKQLGIARDPTSVSGRIGAALNHPLTVGGALLRAAFHPRESRGRGGE
ncbi:ester cyclase [Pendulispora rubella]|uniref:Ester cyclase n=1 Tax=Pendulispora rubella TaxID=2741070 RepID=A0ABZ2LAL0_9BACT